MRPGTNPLYQLQNRRFQRVISRVQYDDEELEEVEEQPETKKVGFVKTLFKIWRGR